MYYLYLGGVQFPTPPKLTVKVKGQNKNLSLLDGGTFTFLRSPALTEISLPLTLTMLGTEHGPDYYLAHLGSFLEEKKPIRFILSRISPAGDLLYDTNMLMSVEDYTTTEDAKNGLDVDVEISLKCYIEHKTVTARIEEIQPSENVSSDIDTTSSKVFIPGTLATRAKTTFEDTEAKRVILRGSGAAVSNATAVAMGGGALLMTSEQLLAYLKMRGDA